MSGRMAASRTARWACAIVLLVGCDRAPQRHTTTVEIVQVQGFGHDAKTAPAIIDIEMKFVDCPGDARKIIRTDKASDACARKLKKGDRVEAELKTTFAPATGSYRSDIVRLGDCSVKTDPKDMANYEIVQVCTDVIASGVPVGIHCNRRREGEIVEKCPWFRRR